MMARSERQRPRRGPRQAPPSIPPRRSQAGAWRAAHASLTQPFNMEWSDSGWVRAKRT